MGLRSEGLFVCQRGLGLLSSFGFKFGCEFWVCCCLGLLTSFGFFW